MLQEIDTSYIETGLISEKQTASDSELQPWLQNAAEVLQHRASVTWDTIKAIPFHTKLLVLSAPVLTGCLGFLDRGSDTEPQEPIPKVTPSLEPESHLETNPTELPQLATAESKQEIPVVHTGATYQGEITVDTANNQVKLINGENFANAGIFSEGMIIPANSDSVSISVNYTIDGSMGSVADGLAIAITPNDENFLPNYVEGSSLGLDNVNNGIAVGLDIHNAGSNGEVKVITDNWKQAEASFSPIQSLVGSNVNLEITIEGNQLTILQLDGSGNLQEVGSYQITNDLLSQDLAVSLRAASGGATQELIVHELAVQVDENLVWQIDTQQEQQASLSPTPVTSQDRFNEPSNSLEELEVTLDGPDIYVSLASTEWHHQNNHQPPGAYDPYLINEEIITWLADQGVDGIRIPLNEKPWLEDYGKQKDNNYAEGIQELVKMIEANGMKVMLDLHWSVQNSLDETAQQQCMPGEYSLQFWQQIAEIYKDNPNVSFEIYNEPFGDLQGEVDGKMWANGGVINEGKEDEETTCGTYEAVGMQKLVDEVRKIAPDNTIFVNGLNHGYRHSINGQSLPVITGENIIYGFHPYGNIPGKQFPYEWERDNGHRPRLAVTEGGHQRQCDGEFQREALTSNFVQNETEVFVFWAVVDRTIDGDCGFPSLFESLASGKITPNAAGDVVFTYTRNRKLLREQQTITPLVLIKL